MSLYLHEFTIPYAGVKRKVIYHFSDCHLAVADADSTPDEVAAVNKANEGMGGCRDWFCHEHKQPYDPALSGADYFEQLVAQCADGDATLCAGDLAECFHPATLQYLDDKTAALNFMTVCGNHDPAEAFPEGYRLSATKQPVQRMDLGDLLVLGFDDSKRVITPQQLDALEEALAGDKPLILLMHIPFGVEGNIHMLRGCGEYFCLNYDDSCPAENHEFVRLIQENHRRIVAVLTGHLHFNHTCPIAGDLSLYGTSQGMAGQINRYIIGE